MDRVSSCYFLLPSPTTYGKPLLQPLSLVNTEAHTTILSTSSRTTLKQTFTNPTNTAAKETLYTFPLYDGVSVVSFTCRVGSRVLRGLVKERNKAKMIYEDAVAKGETAGLLENLLEATDVFSTKIGNIPVGESVAVEIAYVGELKHDAETDGIRFTIPTRIAPRYGSLSHGSVSTSPSLSARAPDSGKIKITVDASMPEGTFIQGIQSPSHPIAVTLGTLSVSSEAPPSMDKASATLSLGEAALEKDFVLILLAKDTATPRALLETHPVMQNHRAMMVSLVPKFSLPSLRPEIVFVADRSGSMQDNIPTLKSALKVFLKSIPVGVKFNICSFGSSYSFIWPKSKSYNQETLSEALKVVDGFDANMGGTETFSAIKATIERRYVDVPLEIMLLTDGDIWQQAELFQYLNIEVKASLGQIRLFSLGIGNGVSHSLIEGIARAGNGFAQTVQYGEKLDSRVVRMLKGALSPHINDYSLEVKYDAEDDMEDDGFEIVEKVTDGMRAFLSEPDKEDLPGKKAAISLFDPNANLDIGNESTNTELPKVPFPKILQAPHQIPPLFPFNRSVVYLLMSPETVQRRPKFVVLRATSSHGPLELEIPVQTISEPGETLHQLAARKAVQDFEEGRGWLWDMKDENGKRIRHRFPSRFDDMVEAEAVRLGVKFQIMNRWCSFVAVTANDLDSSSEEIAHEDERVISRIVRLAVQQQSHQQSRCAPQSIAFSNRAGYSASPLAIPYMSNAYSYGSPSPSLSPRPINFSNRSGGGHSSHSSSLDVSFFSTESTEFEPTQQSDSVFLSATTQSANPLLQSRNPLSVPNQACMRAPPSSTRYGDQSTPSTPDSITIDRRRRVNFPRLASEQPAMTERSAGRQPKNFSNRLASSVFGVSNNGPERLGTRVTHSKRRKHDPSAADHHFASHTSGPAERAISDAEKVLAVIALQDFEGWWEASGVLLELLGGAGEETREPRMGKAQMTALAVVALERRFGSEREVWELVVEKARAWLDVQVGVVGGVERRELEDEAERRCGLFPRVVV